MSIINKNKNKNILTFIIFLVIFSNLQLISVSAENNTAFENNETVREDRSLLFPFRGYYLNQLKQEKEKDNTQEADTETDNTFDRLGFNKIDITELSKYINVAAITEKEFYDLNFGMKIAKVAMTTNKDLLIRTVDNTYCSIEMSDKYINALELTGVLKEGSSLRVASGNSETASNTMGLFIVLVMLSSLLSYTLWFYFMRRKRKSLETGTLMLNTKENNEKNGTNPCKKVTFDEVQGIDELKPDLLRLVDALKNPAKYKKLGARPTKGLILYGPPGTGKT